MTPELLHRNPVAVDPREPRLIFAGGYDGDANVPMHDHSCWEVIYQRTGRVRTQQGADMIEMRPGMVLIHPPRVPHADWVTQHYAIYFMYIDFTVAPDWPRLSFDDERQSIGRLCDDICHEYYGGHGNRDHMIDILVRRLVLLLDRAPDRRGCDAHQTVIAARHLIDEQYRSHLTVDELANAVGVSRSTLHASFSRVFGESPMEYLRGVRLRHAFALLRHTEMTLDCVSDRCGFHSASHLSRHVKAATGSTPGSIRLSSMRQKRTLEQ